MSTFSNGTYNYFSRKLVKDALEVLKDTESIDKGIPDITANTIKFLMGRKSCICGADLSDVTSKEAQELASLLKYIPPQSLGTSISQFINRSNGSIRNSSSFYDTFKSQISTIRACSHVIEERIWNRWYW